jgi:hypothetical protein
VDELSRLRDLCAKHDVNLDMVRLHFLRRAPPPARRSAPPS